MKKTWIAFVLGLTLLLSACGNETNGETEAANGNAAENESNAGNEEKKSDKKTKEKKDSVDTRYADMVKEVLPYLTEDALELTDTSHSFLSKNSELFPAKKDKQINKAKDKTDASVTIKNLNKNATPYFEEILTFEGTVISIEEETEGDETMSYTHVYDDNDNSYTVLMFKDTGDILEEDRVRFWGAPVGGYSFENISGGHTNAQMFVGSHIEKVN